MEYLVAEVKCQKFVYQGHNPASAKSLTVECPNPSRVHNILWKVVNVNNKGPSTDPCGTQAPEATGGSNTIECNLLRTALSERPARSYPLVQVASNAIPIR